MVPENQYRVYIISLKKTVLNEKKFRDANPDYVDGKPCVYVGSTAKPVNERFSEHMEGVQYRSSRWVKKYGRRLFESEMRGLRPRRSRESILRKEREVAEGLRLRGWAVWWN